MPDRKSFTVHYRRLDDPVGAFGDRTLEAGIREALAHVHDGGPLSAQWSRRAWLVPPDNTDTLLMNVFHDDGAGFFGDLTVYTRGFLQSLLRDDPDAAMLAVEQQPPPAGREYIHSMMFWLAIGNHLLAIQSRSLTTKNLEEYLTWLLKTRTGKIAANGHVILNAKFVADEVGGDIDDLREIIVGGMSTVGAAPAEAVREAAPGREREVERHVGLEARRPLGDRLHDVLVALMGNEPDVTRLLDSIPVGAELDVSVHIGYRAKKRGVSRAPMQQALRNLPHGEITAIGRDGRRKGNDLRLSFPVSVLCRGSLVDPDDARAKLRSAYDYFVENGKI